MSAYGDRLVDVLTFQGAAQPGERAITLTLGNPGMYCTGIQKVAQSFLGLFLTDVGSMSNDPDYGTQFMPSLKQGYIYDEAGMTAAFYAAVLDVQNYLANNQPDNLPDETLQQVDLVSWNMQPGSLSLTVRLTTAAGETRTYFVPVETGGL